MWDPVAELTRAFLTELNIGVTDFTIVGTPQCFHVVTIQDLPRGDARVDTHKSTAECVDLEGLFTFCPLFIVYFIGYLLQLLVRCPIIQVSLTKNAIVIAITIHGGSCVTIHIFF